MLRQNSSYRLNQSNIYSSNNRSRSSIIESTSCYAHTAANLAFSRAQGQSNFMRSNPSYDNHSPPDILKTSHSVNTNHGWPEIKPQDSVRFVDPCVIKKRTSTSTRSSSFILHPNISRPTETVTNDLATSECNIPCRSSLTDRKSYMKTITKSHTTTDIYNKYYTKEQKSPLTESSYRRIRKSKSMLTPLKAPDIFYTNGRPEIPGEDFSFGLLASQKLQTRFPKAILRASKSTNFVRSKQYYPESNDTAVRLARDRFLNEAAQHQLREKPLHIFRSRSHKVKKPYQDQFRKSSRDSEVSNVISSIHNQYFSGKDSRFKKLATKASNSLRNRLRRRFGRGYDSTFEVPAQQVDAKKTHVRTYNGDSTSLHDDILFASHPYEASFAHVITRNPSIYEATSSGMKSQAGSIKSIKTYNSDEKSPVSSWNSTAVNTVNSHNSIKYQSKSDRSFEIINKHGIHISQPISGLEKMKNDTSTINQLGETAGSNPDPNVISSVRVYSALMKRLDSKKSRLKQKPSQKSSSISMPSLYNTDESTMLDIKNQGSTTNATIKHITSEEAIGEIGKSHKSKERGFTSINRDSDPLAIKDFADSTISNQNLPEANLYGEIIIKKDDINVQNNSSNDQVDLQIKKKTCEGKISPISFNIYNEKIASGIICSSSEKVDMTTQEIAHEYERLISDTVTLRQNKSTFFGGGTVPIVKTASPLRRAMAEGLCKSNHYPPIQSCEGKIRESDSSYSESIYSCTTSGQSRKLNNSEWSLASKGDEKQNKTQFSSDQTGGDAVIIEQVTYTPKIPNKSCNRLFSSKTPNEWRSWISSEISRFEREKENRNSENLNLPKIPANRHSSHTSHFREDAQITNDDIKAGHKNLIMPAKTFGISQQHSQNIGNPQPLHVQNSKSSIFFDNPRSRTQFLVSSSITSAPLLESESHLRTSQSTSSIRSNDSINAFSSLNRKTNLSTRISSQKENIPHSSLRSNKPDTNIICIDNLTMPDTNLFTLPSTTHSHDSPKFISSSSTKISTKSGYRGLESKSEIDSKRSDVSGQYWNPLITSEKIDIWPLEPNTVGSKEMVELFLNKRRKRLATASEDTDSVFL